MPSTSSFNSKGDQLGRYQLLDELGVGAFKRVFKARALPVPGEPDLPEFVAVAIPFHQDPKSIEAIQKEFDTGHRLEHPSIVRSLALEKCDGITFLVFELALGTNLRSRVARGALDPKEALRLAGFIAEALAYAHEAHVIHRDIKPDNILINEEGRPLILDFGVARILDFTAQQAYTYVGTPNYMAPETIEHERTDIRSDLWSLGVTLYELLTGIRPFEGSNGEAVRNAIRSARYDENRLFASGIDRTVVRLIRKLLQKDPDRRYQSASSLLRDLDAMSRNIRLLDDDEGRLEALLKASVPLICVLSSEEERVLEALQSIAGRQVLENQPPRPLFVWSASRGLRDTAGRLVHPDTVKDPTAALDHAISSGDSAIYAFLDLHRHYTPVTTRLIRDVARVVRCSQKSVVFISPFLTLPPDLEKQVHLTSFQLPDPQLLDDVLAQTEKRMEGESAGSVRLDDPTRVDLVRAALGLTRREAVRALEIACARHGVLDQRAVDTVLEVKTQAIRRSGVLQYIHDNGNFAQVGGLNHLLDWFKGRARFFGLANRMPGLDQPKGVLLVGHPGCGKSLSARALAGDWGVPLIRLDVGRLLGKYVGESEANLRLAIQTAEAVSPCVLWIDEIEKAFAGMRGGGGTHSRVFGQFLNWLQDKKSPVYVVATANDISSLPPELVRKGRFDDVFYVPLPPEADRREIFRIHLAKRLPGGVPGDFALDELARRTRGFSGAEIEAAVTEARFEAFAAGRPLTNADLFEAVSQITPLAVSSHVEFDRLSKWAAVNARPASRVESLQ